MNTPAHADEAIRGLSESSIRSVFAYGFGNTSLVDWWFGPDYTGSVLTSDGPDARRIRKQYFNSDDGLDHDGPRDPRPQLLQARRRQARLGARQGARPQHHRPRGDGPVRLHQDADHGAPRHGPALPEHHLRPRLALHRRGVEARERLGRERLVRAADRGPDGPRLGPRRHGARPRHADRPVVRCRDDGAVRPVHPDALDLRLRARPQAPGGVGRRTSTGWRPRPA